MYADPPPREAPPYEEVDSTPSVHRAPTSDDGHSDLPPPPVPPSSTRIPSATGEATPRSSHPLPPPRISFTTSPRRYRLRRRPSHKNKERNFPAAVCESFVIATLCTAMAETRWFALRGGGCNLKSLGVYLFFYIGRFRQGVNDGVEKSAPKYMYEYSSDIEDRKYYFNY